MKQLSVCVATQQWGRVVSGIGVHARHLAKRLVSDGHRVTVLAPEDGDPGESAIRRVRAQPAVQLSGHARWFLQSVSFGRALRQLQSEGFDVIHFTDAREALFCTAPSPAVGNVNDPYVADARDVAYYRLHYRDWLARWSYYHLARIGEARALRKLGAVIANSGYTAAVVRRRYQFLQERVVECPKCIDAAWWADGSCPETSKKSLRVLFVGGNMQRKGLPALIRAAPAIRRESGPVEFWIVGEDRVRKQMEALCRGEHVLDAFRFIGWCSPEQLRELYHSASVFVMPSVVESFGIVYLEAMAAGLPVVATSVGGAAELVQDGENGLLVSPDDHAGIARAVRLVLMDEGRRREIIERGRRTAMKYNAERMMACTYAAYARAFGERNSG